jgi:hypothetical protein
MAWPQQEAIDTFIGITGADEAVAVRKLEVPPKRPPSPGLLPPGARPIWRDRLGARGRFGLVPYGSLRARF